MYTAGFAMPAPSSTTLGARQSKARLVPNVTERSGSDPSMAASAPAYQTRKKASKKERRADMEAAAIHAHSRAIRTELPSFNDQKFDSFESFQQNFNEYCALNNTSFFVRTSNTRDWKNKQLRERHAASCERASERGVGFNQELHLVPSNFTYFQRVYKCVHSEYQPDRVPKHQRERYQASTKYTACPARITAEVMRVRVSPNNWEWRVVARQENSIHNHACTPAVFESYMNDSLIDDEEMFQTSAAQIRVGGNPREIRDRICASRGAPFSKSQYSYLKHYRLGGREAKVELARLLSALAEQAGARCVILHDQDELIIGIVMQTAIQRILFEKYGDTLVLDWTYNTNNLGFYLGCLMITSVTGKGIHVLDFLSISQGVDMMQAILEIFVDDDPSAIGRVESFIIDKDYKEWKAITHVFQNSRVALCQFHVLKWFKTVAADSRHNIHKVKRPVMLQAVRDMMYAESEDEFLRIRSRLEELFADPSHGSLHEYMKKCWYSCISMWANYQRGKIFTAGNTTSNRLESHWNQLKCVLGKKKRVDRCVEAILVRQTAILRRELAEVVQATTTTSLFSNEHEFIRQLLRDLSASRGKIVKDQWRKYVVKSTTFYAPKGIDETGSGALDMFLPLCIKSQTLMPPPVFRRKKILQLSSFPERALARRWSLSSAEKLIDPLEQAISFISNIRIDKLSDLPVSRGPCVNINLTRQKKLSFRKLRRREDAQYVILDAVEKRNIVEGQCERVVNIMMRLGTVEFWNTSSRLEEAITSFLNTFNPPPGTSSEHVCASPDDPTASSLHEGEICASASDAEVDGEEEDYASDELLRMDSSPEIVNCRIPLDNIQDDTVRDFANSSMSPPPQCPGRVRFPAHPDDVLDDLLSQLVVDDEANEDNEAVACVLARLLARDSNLLQDKASPVEHPDFLAHLPVPSEVSSDQTLLRPQLSTSGGLSHIHALQDLLNASDDELQNDEPKDQRKRKENRSHEATVSVKKSRLAVGKGLFDTFLLPKPTRGAPRSSKQQSGRAVRVAAEPTQRDPKVTVTDFLLGLKYAKLCDAEVLFDAYPRVSLRIGGDDRGISVTKTSCDVPELNFLLARSVAEKIITAIKAARSRNGDDEEDPQLSVEACCTYVATIHGSPFVVSESNVLTILELHELRSVLLKVATDRDWLSDKKAWTRPALTDVPFLNEYAEECSIEAGDDVVATQIMREITIDELNKQSVGTIVEARPYGEAGVSMREIVGCLSHSKWLNDSVMFLVLSMFAFRFKDVAVIDPLNYNKFNLPRARLFDQRAVVFPINFDNTHWCTICVKFDWRGKHIAYMYDPQCRQEMWGIRLDTSWITWVKPFLDAWFRRDERVAFRVMNLTEDATPTSGIGDITSNRVMSPRQTDSSNCGIFCIAQSLCYMTNDFAIQNMPLLSPPQLRQMRLRIMYMLIVKSTVRVDEADALRGAEAIAIFKASPAATAHFSVKK